MQVYRGMDIGTASPTATERAEVRHHLVDLVEVDTEFTVAMFQRALADALADIGGRGGRAVLVGGTGLYHRAAVDGLELAGRWPEIRERLEGEFTATGPRALHDRLVELDPAAAERIEPDNARRIIRALEVTLGSGRPFSSFGPGLDTYGESEVLQIGLRWDRARLAERIAARVHQMMSSGLLDEVAAVLARHPSRTARQALGYRELIDHLEGRCGLDEAVEATIRRTRQFAVRQDRWFRRDPRVRWVDVEHDPVAEALPVVAGVWA
jgi:tRNA dimethylallyltransferase